MKENIENEAEEIKDYSFKDWAHIFMAFMVFLYHRGIKP